MRQEDPASSGNGVLKGQPSTPEADEKKKKNKNHTAKGEAKSEVQLESKGVRNEQQQKRRRLRKSEEEKPDDEARPAKSKVETKGRDEEVHVPFVEDLVSDEETKDTESRAAFQDSYGGTWASWVYVGHFVVEICFKRYKHTCMYACTIS